VDHSQADLPALPWYQKVMLLSSMREGMRKRIETASRYASNRGIQDVRERSCGLPRQLTAPPLCQIRANLFSIALQHVTLAGVWKERNNIVETTRQIAP
jgi:hypothetical protein